MALLGPGQPARDEEAHRPERVGPPYRVVADDAPSPTTSALKVVRLNHSVPANWMMAAHQSIRWCWTLRSDRGLPLGPLATPRVRGRLVVLQERRRREEDGPDEVGEVVRVGPHAPWRRAGTSPGRSRPTRRRRARRSTTPWRAGAHQVDPADRPRVLAVPARLPGDQRAVGTAEHLSGDEGAEAAAARAAASPPGTST